MKTETKVMHVRTQRKGTILNGCTIDCGVWIEYEVMTARGIEIWSADEIIDLGSNKYLD